MALTPKQAAFVREYPVDLNATQAAIRAGFSQKTAKAQGSRLLTNVDVKRAVDAALDARAERAVVTADDVLRGLLAEARTAEQDSARVAAWGLLGKHLKLFTEKHEHTGTDGEPLQVSISINRTVKG